MNMFQGLPLRMYSLSPLASEDHCSKPSPSTMTKPALLFVALFTALLIQGGRSTKLTIKNNCGQFVWPATLSGHCSAPLSQTGFELDPLASLAVTAPAKWSGRIWARTYCFGDASGKFSCLTGDCGTGLACANSSGAPPATIVDLTLQGDGGKDFYDVSNVDGFNLPVSVTPQGGTGCTVVSCSLNLNAWCPPELQLKGPGGIGVVGCKPSNSSQVFKAVCPQACSYANDKATCTFTCVGADYDITFCP